MHWTATTRDLSAALLDPVRGVIERGLASHELDLGPASERPPEPARPPAWSTAPNAAAIATPRGETATTATRRPAPADPVPPALTSSTASARRPLASAHHETRAAPSAPPGAAPHTTPIADHPADTSPAARAHPAPPASREHTASPAIPDAHTEHSPPLATPDHSAPRVRPAHPAPPPNYEHTAPRANYQHSPAPANHEHSAAPAIHEHPAARANPEPAALADRRRSTPHPLANDDHSTATATPGVPLHAHPWSPPAAAPSLPATTPVLTLREPAVEPAASPSVGVPIRPRTPPPLPLTPEPAPRDLATAHHLTTALHPVLTTAAALTTAALAAQSEPRVANHFAVQVQLGAQTSAVDPDALTAALLTLLREAAYRHGLEVE